MALSIFVDARTNLWKIFLLLSEAAYLAFISFGWLADSSMDKSGVGDYVLFSRYNGYADIAIISFAAIYLLYMLCIAWSPMKMSRKARYVILPLIFNLLIYLSPFLINF
ncbi:MAG TPA: hypothetical protein P5077_03510 [bacterium]|nr:hypothetical protein [bacterium]